MSAARTARRLSCALHPDDELGRDYEFSPPHIPLTNGLLDEVERVVRMLCRYLLWGIRIATADGIQKARIGMKAVQR